MADKMQRFVDINARMPDKRTADARRTDFGEIYDPYTPARATEQSSRCEQCGIPYCQIHCPLQNNIPDWLKMTAEEIAWANAEQTAIYRRFQEFFEDIDVLLCPGNSVPPFPVEQLYCDEINGKKTAMVVRVEAMIPPIT